jgi:integrase
MTGCPSSSDGPGGYLSVDTILKRELYPAMKRAGIERVGPTGEKRTFHSFRHTYAKLARERVRAVVKPLRRNLVQRHHVAVDVETHRRPRVAGALRELARDDARLVPDGDSPVTKIVRRVVIGRPRG